MKLKTLFFILAAGASTLSQAAPVPLNNGGFEADWQSVGGTGSDGRVTFFYSPTGPDVGWTFANAGVANNYSLHLAAEGSRFGFLQVSSAMSQSFRLETASEVELSFAIALRPDYAAGQNVNVSIDDIVMGNFAATTTSWQTRNLSLGTLAAGMHTLKLSGMASFAQYGDTTAFIDAVQLSASPIAAPVPEPEAYALMLAGLGLVGWAAHRRRRA